jgi:DNA-binding Lrp family transcriptional regulator
VKDVLLILEKNAKATPEEISEMTGRTPEEVREVIAKAERDQAIIKYKTLINWDRLGEQQVVAQVEVRVAPQRDVGFDSIARRIARFPEVRSLHLVSGGYDLSVLLVGRTMQEVANFVAVKLAALEEVHGTTTHFLLKRYKEDGEILDGEDAAKRLPLTP